MGNTGFGLRRWCVGECVRWWSAVGSSSSLVVRDAGCTSSMRDLSSTANKQQDKLSERMQNTA